MARPALTFRLPFGRVKTPAELSREAERKATIQRNKALRDAGLAYGRIILERFTRLGFIHEFSKRSGRMGIQRVRWADWYVNTEAAYFLVDTVSLPYHLNSTALVQEDILADLSRACGKPVIVSDNAETGLWFIVPFGQNFRGIPHHVSFADMMEHYPASSTSMDVPVGIGANKTYSYRSVAKAPQLLIAGTTGGGKSTWENAILCSLIQRNTPKRLKLIMVDLKRTELSVYRDIPHLMRPIAVENDEALDAINMALGIVDGRLRQFEGQYRDIGDYNFSHRAEPMPRVVIVIDEWANLALTKGVGKKAETALTKLAATSRAAGVHVILCTQRPSVDVVTGLIKANFPTRAAFACADQASSKVILDNVNAHGLAPQGRFIFSSGLDQFEVQAPFINTEIVMGVVEGAKNGTFQPVEEMGHDVTLIEIFRWALAHPHPRTQRAELGYRAVYSQFRERGITVSEVQKILGDAEGTEVEVDGGVYRVVEATNTTSRYLLPVDEN